MNENIIQYRKGDRVKHPTQEEWGLGEVLEDSNGDSVKIFFVGIGEVTIFLQCVQPVIIPVDKASHPVLDNLRNSKTEAGD